jgi:hypothetical protein
LAPKLNYFGGKIFLKLARNLIKNGAKLKENIKIT